VIQVFTKSASGAPGASVRAGYGTDETRDIAASASGSAGPVRFAASASHRASAGFNAITNPADFSYNPDRDGFVGKSGSASAGVTWQPGQDLDVRWFRSDLDAQFDAGPGHDDRGTAQHGCAFSHEVLPGRRVSGREGHGPRRIVPESTPGRTCYGKLWQYLTRLGRPMRSNALRST
jgi:vitamin B12 transporter